MIFTKNQLTLSRRSAVARDLGRVSAASVGLSIHVLARHLVLLGMDPVGHLRHLSRRDVSSASSAVAGCRASTSTAVSASRARVRGLVDADGTPVKPREDLSIRNDCVGKAATMRADSLREG